MRAIRYLRFCKCSLRLETSPIIVLLLAYRFAYSGEIAAPMPLDAPVIKIFMSDAFSEFQLDNEIL